MEDLGAVLVPFLEKYPVLAMIVFVIGSMRLVFKPVTEVIVAIKKHRNPEYDPSKI